MRLCVIDTDTTRRGDHENKGECDRTQLARLQCLTIARTYQCVDALVRNPSSCTFWRCRQVFPSCSKPAVRLAGLRCASRRKASLLELEEQLKALKAGPDTISGLPTRIGWETLRKEAPLIEDRSSTACANKGLTLNTLTSPSDIPWWWDNTSQT